MGTNVLNGTQTLQDSKMHAMLKFRGSLCLVYVFCLIDVIMMVEVVGARQFGAQTKALHSVGFDLCSVFCFAIASVCGASLTHYLLFVGWLMTP